MLALIDTFQSEPEIVREIARWMVNGAEGADRWLEDDTLDTEDDDEENRAYLDFLQKRWPEATYEEVMRGNNLAVAVADAVEQGTQ
jgi:hypothetical protein